jgi:pyruvyl transferase EpsO
MTSQQKTTELKRLIEESLRPIITGDYILLDIPYYANIGDVLIWQGALDFFKTLPYKCLYSSSVNNYRKPEINKETIILLQGGGNFGDLWYRHQIFRKKILQSFPDNMIVLLPQSVYFKDKSMMNEDAEIFSQHKKLTMCFRDRYSLNIANKYFPNSRNILVPDMAFYMDISLWSKYLKPVEADRVLFLNRNDSEKNDSQLYEIVPSNAEIRDWPTMEKTGISILLFKIAQAILRRIDGILSTNLNNTVSDCVYQKFLRKYYIRTGIRFLSAYSYVYTTRLHVAILSVLLGKKFAFFDNSYGKNRGLYEAWLQDVDGIKFIKK